MAYLLRELAERVGGEVDGDGALAIEGVSTLEQAGPGDLSFLSNKKYRAAFESTRAGAVLVEPDLVVSPKRTVLRVANAYLAFAKISTLFHPPHRAVPGIAPEAVVHPTAVVHPSAEIQPLATVGPGARVGARTVLHPGVHLGEGVRVGDDCLLYANVVVRERCILGNRVILQPGCVIGSDGFGFAFDMAGEGAGPRHYKVPQVGIVVVEDDVEIGANSTVDRAALGSTRIGRGSKLDNLVQIAHNVEVGPLSLFAAQVGIAGSTRLGAGVGLWGQVGIVGHLTIGDGVKVAAQSGVINDIPAGETHGGYPAIPIADWRKSMVIVGQLPTLRKELLELKKRVKELEGAATGGKKS